MYLVTTQEPQDWTVEKMKSTRVAACILGAAAMLGAEALSKAIRLILEAHPYIPTPSGSLEEQMVHILNKLEY